MPENQSLVSEPATSPFRVFPVRMPDLSDEDLMDRLRKGHPDALPILFDRYYRLVLRIASRILRDPREAEDVMQEVFLEIFHRAAQFDSAKGSAKCARAFARTPLPPPAAAARRGAPSQSPKDDKPRHLRRGVFGALKSWNPENLPTDRNSIFLKRPPFADGQLTHVAITYSGLGGAHGTAQLYLNARYRRRPGRLGNLSSGV